MGRPRADSNATATTERVLEAALHEFGEDGYAAGNLERIARTAGISRPSLLYHFGSKEELHAAVVSEAFRRLGEALTIAMATEGPFEAQFDAVVDGYVGFLGANPSLSRIILRELLDTSGPGHALLMQGAVPLIKQVEAFIVAHGKGLRRDLPLREAILAFVSAALLEAAAGGLHRELWAGPSHPRKLSRALFFKEKP